MVSCRALALLLAVKRLFDCVPALKDSFNMFFGLRTPDLSSAQEVWLLHERHPRPDGPPRVRNIYRDFVCRKCSRVDELAALNAGVVAEFRPPPTSLDAITTCDQFLIVTLRAHDALADVPGLDVHAYPVPASSGHAVLFPKRQIRAAPDATVYTSRPTWSSRE